MTDVQSQPTKPLSSWPPGSLAASTCARLQEPYRGVARRRCQEAPLRTVDMHLFALLSLAAAVSAQGGEHSLCLDPKMMSAVCTVGTEIGRKMEAAHVKCNGGNQDNEEEDGPVVTELLQPVVLPLEQPAVLPLEQPAVLPLDSQPEPQLLTRRRNGKKGGKKGGKGKKKCGKVDLDLLSTFFGSVWTKKACILKEVGWVSAEDTLQADAVMADIATLDPALSAGLSDTKDLCMARAGNMTVRTMFDSPEFAGAVMAKDEAKVAGQAEKCSLKMLDQDKLGEIETYLKKLAFVTCVHENFMTGCGNFILGNVQAMLESMMAEAQDTVQAEALVPVA